MGPVTAPPRERRQVCLQVATNRSASKHLGHSRNLGNAGLLAVSARRSAVDNAAMPEFGELQGRSDLSREISRRMEAGMWTRRSTRGGWYGPPNESGCFGAIA
jgi:hypothetical protein